MFVRRTDMQRVAATQRELVLVTAMLVTVALIALPGLTETRERARKARCLANLRTMAAAAHEYASDDARELLVPLHQGYASTLNYSGWIGPFTAMGGGGSYGTAEGSTRLAIPHSFGGRTATVPFGNTTILQDPNGFWGARTKPLNRYVNGTRAAADAEDGGVFACPADVGFADRSIYRVAPQQIAGVPLIDVLGNSYEHPGAGLLWPSGDFGNNGLFSVSAVGHTRSSLQQTDRLALFADGPFNSMSRSLSPPGEALEIGWHGEQFSDPVAYCDGSARLTAPVMYTGWTEAVLQEMNYTDPGGGLAWNWFLRKNSNWTTDAYPTPGARIAVRNPAGTIVTPRIESAISVSARTRWPFLNYQNVE